MYIYISYIKHTHTHTHTHTHHITKRTHERPSFDIIVATTSTRVQKIVFITLYQNIFYCSYIYMHVQTCVCACACVCVWYYHYSYTTKHVL